MSIIKVYCGQCGQRVSGDETFRGTVAKCPICSSDIPFPESLTAYTSPSPDPAGEIVRVPLPPLPASTAPAPALPPAPTTFPSELPRAVDPDLSQAPAGWPPASSLPSWGGTVAPLPSGPVAGPVLPGGPPSYQALPTQPAPAPAPVARDPEPKADAEPDPMPGIVFGAGIAAMIPCLGIVCAPVAIILGHLTMMRMDEDTSPKHRSRVLIGTALGYVSLLLLLLTAIAWKFAGPAIREQFLQPVS